MIRFVVFLLSFVIALPTLLIGQENDVHSKINAIAKKYTDNKKTRAIVILYYYNGIPYTNYYGETEPGNNTKPNANSIFEIGAVTNVFTTTLLAQLELKQALSTDDELKMFLPNDVIVPLYQKLVCKPDKDITHMPDGPETNPVKFTPYICVPDPKAIPEEIKLCYLASHTAGFPLNPKNLKKSWNRKDPYANYSKDDLYTYLKNYKLKHSLGTVYKYSNTGMALLGHALALNQQKSIENLYQEYIWSPLKMTTTSLALNKTDDNKVLKGYTKSGKKTGLYHYKVMASTGGIRSTPNDMMIFLGANLTINQHDLSNAVTLTQQPRLAINKKGIKNSHIAMAWYISPLSTGKKVVWQNGNTAGHSAFIGFIKDTKTGVVIMANNNCNLKPMATEILKLLK